MVTRIRKGAKPHLYIGEHMAAKGLTDAIMAGRLDVAPVTVWRWRTGKRKRLAPETVADIANAIGLEGPESLYKPPDPQGRESIDAKLKGAPDAVYEAVKGLVESLTKKAS